MSRCKAPEIPRNEAYMEVRRSASGPEGLRPGGTRDEGNAADGRFPTASMANLTKLGNKE
jgi:hypothetical protein